MNPPSDRRYLPSHEWHQLQGKIITLGITQRAADELTDITFVALPPVGKKLRKGESFGEIESVKATSDLYCGVDGVVVEVNQQLTRQPGLVNQEPYSGGWMIRIEPENPDQLQALLNSDDYAKQSGQ